MLLLSLAFALTPEQADDRIRSMHELKVEPSLYRRVEKPFVVRQGAMEVVVTEGVLVPVFSGHYAGTWESRSKELLRDLRSSDKGAELPSAEDRGDRELVGFVWIDGEAEVRVSLPRRADAIELASRQVMYAGADRDAMREVARQRQPYATTAKEGLFLSTDPQIDAWFLGGKDGDPYDVVVYESDPVLVRAGQLLQRRLDLWEDLSVRWGSVVAEERLLFDLGVEVSASWLIDLHTADRYARVSEMPTQQDRWLAHVDRHGMLSEGWATEVVAAGVRPEGWARRSRISGERMPLLDPSDPTSGTASGLPLEPVHAEVRVLAHPPRGELQMEIEITERLTLRASQPTAFAWISVPRVEARRGSFEWVGASLPDGTPLSRPGQVERKASEVGAPEPKPKPKPKERKAEWQRLDELDRARQKVRLVFPEVVQPGEEVQVDLQWSDTWPVANLVEVDGVNTAVNLGMTSGMQRFLPSIDGRTPPWGYRLSVGLPVDSRFDVAVSGRVESEEEVDGWRLRHTAEVPYARYPSIAVGRYDHKEFPARKGLPKVHVHLLDADPKQLQGMAVEARAAMAYMARYLPPYGLGEYDIVEAPSAIDHYTWVAPHGMQMMQRMLKTQVSGFREDQGRATFAHEVAHQWWGQMAQPASLDDRWMIETFAEVFSCMYVAKANEKVEPCVDVLEETRKLAEGETWWADVRSSASLEEAFVGGNKNQVVYSLGPYVMLNMLRPRVGTEAFFGALGTMLREHPYEPVTNERLQAYMERASGRDLDDFFDFWVLQGILPAVELTWSSRSTVVELEVTSDVPFGTFDIPVVVHGDFGKKVVAVTVKDGAGRLSVEGDYRRTVKVVLDPAHRTLTRARRVSKR